MCQKACWPEPKTVRVCTLLRLIRRQAEARAVRKAVRVEAWSMPTGAPEGEKRVIAPVGAMRGRVSEGDWEEGPERVITVVC